MPAFTTVRNAILADYFGTAATAMGTPLEIGLSTTQPNADGSGITEPSGGAYSRQSVANTDAEWTINTTDSYASNDNEISYAQATADWGIISHFVIYQGGNPKFFGEITDSIGAASPKNVQNGDRFLFVASGLKVYLV